MSVCIWWANAALNQAMAVLERAYPGLPVGGLDGGGMDEYSTYLHVIVCYDEYEAMRQLVGDRLARDDIEYLKSDRYRAIYALVEAQAPSIKVIVDRYHLEPNEMSVRR